MTTISGQQQIADFFGVSRETINAWQRDGFPVAKRGGSNVPSEYDSADCIRWFVARELSAGRSSDNEHDLTAERARLAHHQANIAALDESRKRGELIPADQVKEKWLSMIGAARSRLLALPTRIASTCVGHGEIEIEREARALVHEALSELARGGE
ncbi:MAG TPA: hypothetical protein DCL53_06840 [Thauera sp.]|nr:hypothetical protein [Thauera sp.]